MILESLIKDERRIALSCCNTAIKKGDVIEIPDKYFGEKEIQGAIKLGFVQVVGDSPAIVPPAEVVKEPTKKFLSKAKYKIAFECIRGCVEPGKIIEIPESKTLSMEVQNAINSGMIEDLDGEYSASPTHQPVVLEEVVLTDEPTTAVRPPVRPTSNPVATPRTPEQRPAPARQARPRPVTTRQAQQGERLIARPIGRVGGGGGGDDDCEIVDGESQLHVPRMDIPTGRVNRFVPADEVSSALDEVVAESRKTSPKASATKATEIPKDSETVNFFDVFKVL